MLIYDVIIKLSEISFKPLNHMVAHAKSLLQTLLKTGVKKLFENSNTLFFFTPKQKCSIIRHNGLYCQDSLIDKNLRYNMIFIYSSLEYKYFTLSKCLY